MPCTDKSRQAATPHREGTTATRRPRRWRRPSTCPRCPGCSRPSRRCGCASPTPPAARRPRTCLVSSTPQSTCDAPFRRQCGVWLAWQHPQCKLGLAHVTQCVHFKLHVAAVHPASRDGCSNDHARTPNRGSWQQSAARWFRILPAARPTRPRRNTACRAPAPTPQTPQLQKPAMFIRFLAGKNGIDLALFATKSTENKRLAGPTKRVKAKSSSTAKQ